MDTAFTLCSKRWRTSEEEGTGITRSIKNPIFALFFSLKFSLDAMWSLPQTVHAALLKLDNKFGYSATSTNREAKLSEINYCKQDGTIFSESQNGLIR